ncbi:DDE-type integrase/transposase/recombinase [Acrocarpospora pleiomorpha]|uniref:DDE-type integrase/transposase/recombinase n=1 Tax=Acrocarpospora pleiomorpha TaxID=90975 RepID=UPI0012D35404
MTAQEPVVGVTAACALTGRSLATLLDEGTYLCSISTMYRLPRARGEVRERRRHATHPARVRPELVARGPSQVFSWDITKLVGPARGVYYDLYVMIDIYWRYVVHWQVHTRESAGLAERFITDAIAANGGRAPGHVHADRGTSMTSKPVAALPADLNPAREYVNSSTDPVPSAYVQVVQWIGDGMRDGT